MKNLSSKKTIIIILMITILFLSLPIRPSLANEYPFIKNANFILKGSFSTYCANSSNERKHNISLAVKSIDKTFIDDGATFSFNETVGERSEKRGYKSAKIIVGGKFADGVGGGVCQVSTTLYNAVILSGLTVVEHHAHSLPVSYVEPSFDAMVSYRFADLCFINDTGFPVYLRASFDGNKISVNIFGAKNQYRIVRKSVITEKIEVKTQTIYANDLTEYIDFDYGETILSYGKEGIKSEGYLLYYSGEKLIKTKKLRKDKYLSQDKIVVVKTLPEENLTEFEKVS